MSAKREILNDIQNVNVVFLQKKFKQWFRSKDEIKDSATKLTSFCQIPNSFLYYIILFKKISDYILMLNWIFVIIHSMHYDFH